MSNRLPFAALAVACLAAAAAGGYIATRQNAIPAPASAQAGPVVPAAQPAAQAQPAVQETEATVTDTARKPAPSSSKSSNESAPAKRRSEPMPPLRAADARVAKPQSSAQATTPQLQGTWPSSAAQVPPPAATPAPIEPAPRADEHAQEPQRAPEPPQPTLEDLVIARDSVIGLQTTTRVSTETAHVEDRVEARVTRDVKVGDRVAIPAGAKVIGSVTQVDRGGKFKEQARLGIRFHTIVLADGTNLPVSTETIVRLGDPPGNGSAAKIGGGAVG